MSKFKSYITPLSVLSLVALAYGLWKMYFDYNLLDYFFGQVLINGLAVPSFILNLLINKFAKDKKIKQRLQWVTLILIVLFISFLLIFNP